MDGSKRTRAKELFLALLEEPEDERAAVLARASDGDEELIARVRELLAAHERSAVLDGVLAARGVDDPLAASEPVLPGGGSRDAAAPLRFGDYEILEEIASGAVGTVYCARQTSLSRVVALKMLRAGRFASEGEVRRFRAEAEAVARLDHPNIVPVYEVGELEGRHFFSMKLVEGASLAECGERFHGEARAAARLVATVARAVHHAHQHGVLHRDLKPSNVLIDAGGTPYVADFGIAKRVGEASADTATGWICGTPAYMAPEQASERGEVTVASDVYSLGCVLHELLAGEPPFSGKDLLELLRRAREEEPPRLREAGARVDRDLETIAEVCLAKDPARRYPSALALAEDLERWLAHRPIRARPATALERARLFFRRRPLVASLYSIVALLVLLIAVGASATSLVLRTHLERARSAEREAHARLRSSLVAQAIALRQSSLAGRRERSLALLAQAAALEPGPDLVDEAVTCLSLVDLAVAVEWPRSAEEDLIVGFDDELERVALATADGRVIVRRARDGAELALLSSLAGRAWTARFAPGGRLLGVKYHGAHPLEDAQLALWDLSSRQVVLQLAEPVAGVALDFDPKGRWLAFGTVRGIVRVLELDTLGELFWIDVGAAPGSVRFSPDGALLAVATGEGGTVELFRLPDGERVPGAIEVPAIAHALAWSPDGAHIALASFDYRVRVYGFPSLELEVTASGHQSEAIDVMYSAEGLLASYSWDGTTRVWDARTGQELVVADARARGFSTDGRRLAFSGHDSVGIWSVEHYGVFRALHGHAGKSPACLAANAASGLLATGGEDGVLLWDLHGERRVAALDAGDVLSVLFAPDGSTLYTSGERGLLAWPLSESATQPAAAPRTLLSGASRHADISADGRVLAAVQGSELCVLLDGGAAIGPRLAGFFGLDRPSVSPAGNRVAAGSWRGRGVRVWDIASGAVERDLLPELAAVRVRFSADGERLVTGASEEFLVWRVGDWEVERSIPRKGRNPGPPGAIAFGGKGGPLAVAADQRIVQLFDARGETLLATLAAADPQAVADMCFVGDSSTLAVANWTRRVQLWRLDALEAELRARGLSERLLPFAGELPGAK